MGKAHFPVLLAALALGACSVPPSQGTEIVTSADIGDVPTAGGASGEPRGSSTPPSSPGEADPSVTPTTASLRLLLTDAPGDFDNVWIDLRGADIGTTGASGAAWIAVASEAKRIDLLTLQNGITALLDEAKLEPGHYTQLRLLVDHADVVSGDTTETLTIPSGAQTGIKIDLDFEVEAGKTYELVLDFDASRSIRRVGDGFEMTPVVGVSRIAEVEDAGEEPRAREAP